MFSAIVRPSTTSSSWYIVAMPSSIAASGVGISTTSPSQAISPSSGRWTPASILMSVDLPAPFWPRTQCTSPGTDLEVDSAQGVDAGEGLRHASDVE